MKWVGITGSWRTINNEVEDAVRKKVREIFIRGDGIVTGGALGVDFIATDEAMRLDPAANYVKIILPTSLDIFCNHYLKRSPEGVITMQQAKDLIRQLRGLREINPTHLENMSFDECTPQTYYARNSKVVEKSDALEAFLVNQSAGTQDTIDKALQKGIPVSIYSFTIQKSPLSRS